MNAIEQEEDEWNERVYKDIMRKALPPQWVSAALGLVPKCSLINLHRFKSGMPTRAAYSF